jgi:hypothetical protein
MAGSFALKINGAVSVENRCPECGETATHVCKCLYRCSRCVYGHKWHTCIVHKRIVPSELENHEPKGCTCLPEKKD